MELELVAEGLRFPEGPVAMADGSVILTEIRGPCLTRVRPDGSKEVLAETGPGPNGAAIGPDGAVWIASMAAPSPIATRTASPFPGRRRRTTERVDPALRPRRRPARDGL